MVRNYQRKRSKRDESQLRGALLAIQMGESLRTVSRNFGIPRTTLYLHRRKNEKNLPTPIIPEAESTDFLIVHHGREKVFSIEQESELKGHMLHFSNTHFGLTSAQARMLAFEFAAQMNVSMPKSWCVNLAAGMEWFRSFIRRHPELSLRKTEHNGLIRNKEINRDCVTKFFTNYKKKTMVSAIETTKKIDPLATNQNEESFHAPLEVIIKSEEDPEVILERGKIKTLQEVDVNNEDLPSDGMVCLPARTLDCFPEQTFNLKDEDKNSLRDNYELTTTEARNLSDDYQVFCDYISTVFRALNSEENRMLLRRKIQRAIIEVSEIDNLQLK